MEYILDKNEYHHQLQPVVDGLSRDPSRFDTGFIADLLWRLDQEFQQIDPVDSKQASSIVDNALNHTWEFMNYPNIQDSESYINFYAEDISKLMDLDSFYFDDDNEDQLCNIIKSALFIFLSLLEK